MFYQTCWLAIYAYKIILKKNLRDFIKRIGIDVVIFTLVCGLGFIFTLKQIAYISWLFLAIKVVLSASVIMIFVELIFDRSKILNILKR